MSAPSKYSKQREAILTFLKSRYDHPTADTVYENIRAQIPNISLGTVYRNLNQLSESGIITRLYVDGKTDHFDACTEPHSHFRCTNCGLVQDINGPSYANLIDSASNYIDGTIDSVSIIFSGTCINCKTNL